MGFFLFILAYTLFLPLSLINWVVVLFKGGAKGYFRSSAISIDKFANREFRTLWNVTLRKPYTYEFGHRDETLSSVLGKLQRSGDLTRAGKYLSAFLDLLDKNHCFNSIDDTINNI